MCPALSGGLAVALAIGALALVAWPEQHHFRAGSGGRELAMEDGSIIRLAPGAALEVRFDASRRLVRLETGNASFTIFHDTARPFIVMAGETQVKVVGTRFDVRYSAGCTRIGVNHGIVAVTPPASPTRRLIAGEETASVDLSSPASACAASGEIEAGRFSYRDAPLSVIVADANRFHRGRISIQSPQMGDERLTTSFSIDQIDQMLDSLPDLLTVRVARQPDGSVRIEDAAPSTVRYSRRG